MIKKRMDNLPNWFTERFFGCEKCSLCEYRKSIIPGHGKIPCDILFIGEAPGNSEDLVGKPFVGQSGQFLYTLCQEAKLNYFRKFFTNTVFCKPWDRKENKTRAPKTNEIKICKEHVLKVINFVEPKTVVFVGKLAERTYAGYCKKICPVFAIRHPAAMLREGKQESPYYLSTLRTLTEIKQELTK